MTRSCDQNLKVKPRRYHNHLDGKEGQLLLAAFQCIVEKGIAATSTHAIARKAGLNQGVIHYYFKSKDELFKRVNEILFHNAAANVETLCMSDLLPVEKLDAFLALEHYLILPSS